MGRLAGSSTPAVKEIDDDIKWLKEDHEDSIKALTKEIKVITQHYQCELATMLKRRKEIVASEKQIKKFTDKGAKSIFPTMASAKKLEKAKWFLKLWGIKYFCDKQPNTNHRSLKPRKSLTRIQRQILARLADKVNVTKYHRDNGYRLFTWAYREKDGTFVVERFIFNTLK